jgi:phage-related baseplate assembly protein
MLAWQKDNTWYFAAVAETDETALSLTSKERPDTKASVYKMIPILLGSEGVALPLDFAFAAKQTSEGVKPLDKDKETEPVGDENGILRYRKLKNTSGVTRVFYIPLSAAAVGTVTTGPEGEFFFDGDPGHLAGGQWVVAEDCSSPSALRIKAIRKLEDQFAVTFESSTMEFTRLRRLIGPFQEVIHPAGYDRNETKLLESKLTLARNVPDSLTRGKVILLEQEKQTRDGFVNAFKVVIKSVNTDARTIVIDLGLDASAGFTIGNTVLRGNVVTAGHGEKKPAKVLGNGNAAQSNQTFLLTVDNVSFIQDATMPSGVSADLELVVDKRTWTQVATLHNSEPTDSHYTVRLTEDNHLLIQTGDGKHGRRLPTGTNNVTVRYRVGNGLGGNIKAGSISKPVKPLHLIDSVRQPLDATGGNGLEGIESLRDSAPATVLTLERAVSLRDYASLAGAQSSVWQATALVRQRKGRGRSCVEVVVVPAGGGELGDLQYSLTATLQAHALPTVDVEVTRYNPVHFHVDVKVRVKLAAYEPEKVMAAVRSRLLNAFTLRHRRLGQDLYVSEVFRVVEDVVGVENSICIVNGDSSLQRVPASDRSVVFIDPNQSVVQVEAEEYKL